MRPTYLIFIITFICSSFAKADFQEDFQETDSFLASDTNALIDSSVENNPSIKAETSTEQEIKGTKGLKADWKTNFKINVFSDRSTTNSILSTEIYGKINWELIDSFSFYTEGLVIGRSGFTQSIYDRTDRKNGLYLLEGYFDIILSENVFFRFGSVRQDFLQAPLVITDKTFPSLIQNITLPFFEDSKISFIFQQSIPDNATEAVKRETQVVKWTPFFLTSSVFLDLVGSKMSLQEKFTTFYFTNLSAAVAELGRIRGNTIDLMGSDSQFKYKFFTMHNNINLQIPFLENWIFELGGDFLINILAPNSYNQGERAYLSLYHNYRNFLEVKFSGEYFANQSDTSVAYYNSEVYGHNNRVGGLFKLETHLYNSGVTLGMAYVYSQPINPRKSSIGEANSFSVFLGTNYVSI
ncbi:MAG: hypothetical protein ACR2M7_02285 [Bdellovibrionales bacterium]